MSSPTPTDLGGYVLTASLSNGDDLDDSPNVETLADLGITAPSFPSGNTIWAVPRNAVAFRYRCASGGNFLGAQHDGAASTAATGTTNADMSPWFPCRGCRFIHWSGSTGDVVIEYTVNGQQPTNAE